MGIFPELRECVSQRGKRRRRRKEGELYDAPGTNGCYKPRS